MADYSKVGLNDGDDVLAVDLDQIETQYDTAKSEQRNGSWPMLGNLLPDADGVGSLGTLAKNFQDVFVKRVKEQVHFKEDFLGCDFDADLWTVDYHNNPALTEHAGTCVVVADVDGGVLRLTTANTADNDNASIYLDGPAENFGYYKGAVFDCRMKLGSIENGSATCGFGTEFFDNIMFQATQYGTWLAVVENEWTDTEVAMDTDWHRFTIICLSGSVLFYIDEVLVHTQTSVNVALDSARLTVAAMVTMLTGPTAKSIDIDYMEAWQER
jgi:hypothetical protein